MPGRLFVAALIAGGIGVWAGVTYAGTANGPRIERVLGVIMILMAGSMMLARDVVNRSHTQLTGAGFLLLGVSYLVPSGWWRTAISLLALGVMLAATVRRRRAAAARPPS